MERYVPVKELPEDIQQLPHEDTVCRFCGISYLVHHEIKRLEGTVQTLQEKIQRLQQLEDLSAIWDKEKFELQKMVQQKEERLSVSQSSLDALRSELSTLRACYTELQTEFDSSQKKLKESNQDARVLSTCREIAAICATVKSVRQHSKQLLRQSASQLAAVHHQIVQKSSSQECQWKKNRSELISKMNELEQQLASELKQSAILIEQWKYTKLELEEKLSKSQTEHQTLEAKLAAAERQLQAETLESKKHQDNVTMLAKNISSLESKLSAVRRESNRQIGEKEEELRSLKMLLSEAEQQFATTEQTLKEREQLFSREKQSLIAEKQVIEVSLHKAEKQASKMREEIKILTFKNNQDIQQLQVMHNDELARVTRLLRQEQAKVKSALLVGELEHKRVVQALQEDLKKEKDVFDRELHHHLEQVRAMELKLAEQQREKEKAASVATAALTCCKEELQACVKQCNETKSNLSMAYQEIAVLQSTVQKECEEREQLLSQLAQLRAQKQKDPTHRRK